VYNEQPRAYGRPDAGARKRGRDPSLRPGRALAGRELLTAAEGRLRRGATFPFLRSGTDEDDEGNAKFKMQKAKNDERWTRNDERGNIPTSNF